MTEQLNLIDVNPEGCEEIIKTAKLYKAAQCQRIEALNEEKAQKQVLLDLVDKSGLTRLPDGTIKFTADGFTITVTPRDELVQVKETSEAKE